MSSHRPRRTARFITASLPLASSLSALVAASILTCPSAHAVLTGQWLFEEGSGTTALNTGTLGAAANGTLTGVTGTPTYAPGLYVGSNFSLRFNSDGTTANQTLGQKVLLPNDLNLIRNAPGATIMAWVKLEGTGTGGTGQRTVVSISNNDTAANSGQGSTRGANLQVLNNTNQVRALGRIADTGGNSNVSSAAPNVLTAGQTYFLTSVFDYAGSGIRVYINGVQVASSTPAWTMNVPDTANLTRAIGTVNGSAIAVQEYWSGLLDGVRVFDTALTAQEILDTYNAELLATANADFDGQDPVDGNDFLIWQRNLGVPNRNLSTGDSDADSDADGTDLANWRSHFGQNSAIGAAGAVPEPATAGLMLAAALALVSRRRRVSSALGIK